MSGGRKLHLPGMSESQIAAMAEACCRPEGTFEFAAAYPGLHDAAQPDGILFELVAGAHVLRLAREETRVLRGYHSSPGTGTRVATIELAALAPAEMLHIFFCWSPSEVRLAVGQGRGAKLIQVTGETSCVSMLKAGCGRSVVPVSRFWVRASTPVVRPWSLRPPSSCGAAPWSGSTCSCRASRPPGSPMSRLRAVLAALSKTGPCVSSAMANQINFQDFERCKTAYAAAYGIGFGRDLGVSSQSAAS